MAKPRLAQLIPLFAVFLGLGAGCESTSHPSSSPARTQIHPVGASTTPSARPAGTATPTPTSAIPLPSPVPPLPSPTYAPCSEGCLDLVNDQWRGRVDLVTNENGAGQLEWRYRWSDPARTELATITYYLREDITEHSGFLLRLYVAHPEHVHLGVFFVERDGDTILWEPNQESAGWVVIVADDLSSQGQGPFPWDPGDHVREVSEIDRIRLEATDVLDRTRQTEGTVVVGEFRLLNMEGIESLRFARAWGEYLANEMALSSDLEAIGGMDDPRGWVGPESEDIEASGDGIGGSLAVQVDLEPGRHIRLERNLVAIAGQPRAFDGDAPPELIAVDMTSVRSVIFRYRADFAARSELAFRLWDRSGGFLEWIVAAGVLPSGWTEASLAIPATDATSAIDLHSIGGFNWEVRALDEPVRGRLWLDELRFDAATPGQIEALLIARTPPDYYEEGPHSTLLVSSPEPSIHLVVNTPTNDGFFEGRSDLVIEEMEEVLDRFSGVVGLEYMLGPPLPSVIETLGEARVLETVVEVATWLENNRVPFYLTAAGGGLSVTPAILEAAIAAAPTMCQGAIFAEPTLYPEEIGRVNDLLRVLSANGKRALFYRYVDQWWQLTLDPDAVETIFAPEYRDVVVPMWENLEPSCLSLTMGSTMGFWVSGRASNWGASVQSWGWSNMRWTDTQPPWNPPSFDNMPAQVWLRMLLGSVALGASYIEIEPEWAFRDEALQALEVFARLVQRGIVAAPASPEGIVSLPNVVLQTERPQDTWGWGPGVLRCATHNPWARSRVVPTDTLAAFLYRSSHFYEDMLPETPFGVAAIVPPGPVPDGYRVLTTDGWGIRGAGRWHYGGEAAELIHSAFSDAASELPFGAEDCLFSAFQIDERNYLAYLIDPEERFPVGVNTFLDVRLDASWVAFDAITGEELPSTARGIPVEIRPGGFRLVHIMVQ